VKVSRRFVDLDDPAVVALFEWLNARAEAEADEADAIGLANGPISSASVGVPILGRTG